MPVGGIAGRCLLVSGRYASEFFNLRKEFFDQVPLLIGVFRAIVKSGV